jgi:hypothetical protein
MTAAAFQTAYEDARPFSPEPFDGGTVVRTRRANPWPAPDMTILTGGRTTPPVMPTDIFGSLWPLIRDLAAGAGAPVDYVAVGVLGVVASLVGAKRRVTVLGGIQPEKLRECCRAPCPSMPFTVRTDQA